MTARRIEIGIDCAEPNELAPFWATALGYEIGDLDADGTYLDLVPPDGGYPGIYLQRVPEPKTTKNRLHLDLFSSDPEALIVELVGRGATCVSDARTGSDGGWWRVLADPAGNEFCVCRES